MFFVVVFAFAARMFDGTGQFLFGTPSWIADKYNIPTITDVTQEVNLPDRPLHYATPLDELRAKFSRETPNEETKKRRTKVTKPSPPPSSPKDKQHVAETLTQTEPTVSRFGHPSKKPTSPTAE